jgi:hypothetical protein
MRKFIAGGLATLGITVGAVGMLASGASAEPVAKGGCPTASDNSSGAVGWLLSPPIGDDAKFDKNGDGLICVRSSNGNGNSVTFYSGYNGATVKDNNQPL